MRILTWNINGIRAVTGKTGVKKMLDSLNADLVCLQETKVTRDMLDEPTAIVDGYESYFSFSRKRTGYSGTANYCSKQCTPVSAEEGLTGRLRINEETSVGCYGNTDAYSDSDLEALDSEGRCVITKHRLRLNEETETEVAIINVYVPRAGDRPDRLEYKLRFLSLLRSRAQALLQDDVHVIILGDLNLTHTAKDNCDPKSDADFLRRSSRVWMNNMLRPSERDPGIASSHPDLEAVALSSHTQRGEMSDEEDDDILEQTFNHSPKTRKNTEAKSKKITPEKQQVREDLLFSDVYRYLHPDETTGYTNWDTSTDARKSNYGRRLDYILVDTRLACHVTDCRILTEVEGSDHCPVVVTLNCQPLPFSSSSPPQLCSKLMPEFRGQQQKLSSFFTKTVVSKEVDSVSLSSSQGSVCSSQEEVNIINDAKGQLKKSASVPDGNSTRISSPNKTSLKRGNSGATNVAAPKSKKVKQTGPKQISLTSFFAPKTNSSVHSESKPVQNSSSNTKSEPKKVDKGDTEHDVVCVEDQNFINGSDILAKVCSPSKDKNIQNISNTANIKKEKSFDKACTLATSSQEVKSALTSSQSWKTLLCGPAPPPLCPGHKEPCVLKTVRKNGPNKNKQFYSCPRPDGPPGNPQYRCNFFQWLNDRKKKKT
ncbi:DNA-(apurinic or apyrimidinic site) lyase [Elysia marginata]|uniref:DNA-(apurinic or apyrimidinic site) endonuclease n=1 Tax=Elysia marginata TaxID=1093978 RepID=A0AAV4G694_9GAST|nr:DNA-(apurinic or apyrimidinic site) lyase [Elysia marginata]